MYRQAALPPLWPLANAIINDAIDMLRAESESQATEEIWH